MNPIHICAPVTQDILINKKEKGGHDFTYSLRCDDMLLFFLVETGNSFDGHVVSFGGTRSKNDVFRVCTNQIRDMLRKFIIVETETKNPLNPHLPCVLHCLLGFPSVSMRPAMRVSVQISEEWKHCIEYSRIHWSCCLLYM